MNIPKSFVFSQSSLQDYFDCPRRFKLRYIDRLQWPAVESEPELENEQLLKEGQLFHRLVHQYMLGIPAEKLTRLAFSPNLNEWWEKFLQHKPELGDYTLFPENNIQFSIGGYRLAAKYDLVAIKSGEQAKIFDWKTYQKRPSNEWLAARWQTRVYPALMAQAGSHLNQGQPIEPEQIEMIYWFVNYPTKPAQYQYNATKLKRDLDAITNIIQEILDAPEFSLTEQTARCRFCTYRSLCDRGIQAGLLDAMETELETETSFDLNFEQIQEIEY